MARDTDDEKLLVQASSQDDAGMWAGV